MAIVGIAWFLVMIVVGVVQFYAGYVGIEYHLGTVLAVIAVVVGLTLRFTLPLTIGTYFGAVDVFGWEWYWAVLLAVPGLLFMIPATITTIIESVTRSRAGNRIE